MTSPWPRRPMELPSLWAANPACAHLSAVEVRLARLHLDVKPSDVEGPITGLIVGESPSRSTSKHLPMFPFPARSSGGRLLVMSGMTAGQFLGRMRRIDLEDNPDAWSASSAKAAAARVMQMLADDLAWRLASTSDAKPLRMLLLGARVSAAFGIKLPFQASTIDGFEVRNIPHPSARNPAYLDEKIAIAAGIAIRWCGGYL